MIITKYDSGLLHSCMYVLHENGHAIVIDPCNRIDIDNKLIVDYLIVTHEHYDHISGVNEWKKFCGAPLICSVACANNLPNPKKNMSRYFDSFCEIQSWIPIEELDIQPVEYICEADYSFKEHETIEWQGHNITLMEIPGHSEGSIGIDIDGTDFFSGDSMLEKYDIELRFPGGSQKKWEQFGRKIVNSIKVGTRIWPGHFEPFVLKNDITF